MVISRGHRVTLPFARKVIMHFSDKYRIPQITRHPDYITKNSR